MTEPKETDVAAALKFIFEESWPATGDDFFCMLVRHLAGALGVRYAFIAEYTDLTMMRVRTLAFWMGEDFGENIEYDLSGTPCENVRKGNLCCYSNDLQALFPMDEDLVTLGVQSYLGIPFYDSSNKLLGHMVVMDTKPMNDEIQETMIFKIFTARAGAELERKLAQEELKVLRDNFGKLVDQRTRALKTTNEQLQQEITECKKVQKEQVLLTVALKAAGEGIMITDHSGVIQYVNRAFERIFLYKCQEVLGRRPSIFKSGKQSQKFYKEMWDTIRNGRNWQGVIINRKKDGALCDVEETISPIRNSSGNIVNYIAVMEDITERKRVDELSHLLAMVTENIAEGISLVQVNTGQIVYTNSRFLEMFGYSSEEIIGKHVSTLNAPCKETPEEVVIKILKALDENGIWKGEIKNIKKDGAQFWSSATVSTFEHSKYGRVCVSISTDITEYKQIEKNLQNKSNQLQDISQSMLLFLKEGNWKKSNALILRNALSQTESEYGFIGVMVDGILRVIAHEGAVWAESIGRDFYEQTMKACSQAGYFEFTDLDNPYGKVITSGKAVIFNEVSKGSHSSVKFPDDHLSLHSFLGVPIKNGQEIFGMIGVANRPGGYTGREQAQIEILTQATSVLCDSYRRQVIEDKLKTERKQAEKALQRAHNELEVRVQERTKALKLSESELRKQKITLEKKNIALNEIIAQIDIEKNKVKENIMLNVDQLIIPNLIKLRRKGTPLDRKSIDLLEKNLGQLTSTFGVSISQKYLKLTPREIEICNMIKNGLNSKEIAGLLHITYRSIELHRTHIRRKLGISLKKINLTSYLQFL